MADDDPAATELRARELGLSYLEQCALEQNQPWIKHWSARWGRGTANLRAWLVAGCPDAERDKLCASGSPAAVSAVRALVDRLPPAVRWHVVEHIAIAWVPPGLGLSGPWPIPPARPEGRIDSGFSLEHGVALMAHELAHSWHRDPDLFANLNTAQIEELDAAIREMPGAAERDERSNLSERAADQLASLWTGATVDTSGGRELARRLSFGET